LKARKLLILRDASVATTASFARVGYSLGTVAALAALLFFAGGLASAQEYRTFSIPFHTINKMILLDATVNGKPIILVLDTGAVQTQVDRKTMMRHEDFAVLYVDLKISTYRHSDYRILATDLRPILKGIPADGILGEDWLRSFRAVRIDYKAGAVELETGRAADAIQQRAPISRRRSYELVPDGYFSVFCIQTIVAPVIVAKPNPNNAPAALHAAIRAILGDGPR